MLHKFELMPHTHEARAPWLIETANHDARLTILAPVTAGSVVGPLHHTSRLHISESGCNHEGNPHFSHNIQTSHPQPDPAYKPTQDGSWTQICHLTQCPSHQGQVLTQKSSICQWKMDIRQVRTNLRDHRSSIWRGHRNNA